MTAATSPIRLRVLDLLAGLGFIPTTNPVLGAMADEGGRALRGKAKPGLCVGSNPTPAGCQNRGSICPDRSQNSDTAATSSRRAVQASGAVSPPRAPLAAFRNHAEEIAWHLEQERSR